MIRAIVAAPFLLLLILFALSNTEIVHLRLWPTDYVLDLPLSLAILLGMALAFVIGGLLTWITGIGARQRARRSERRVSELEADIAGLRARLAQRLAPVPLAPGTAPSVLARGEETRVLPATAQPAALTR